MWTKQGEIRRDDNCLDSTGTVVRNMWCHGVKGNQFWNYDAASQQFVHQPSHKCLTVSANMKKVVLNVCNKTNPGQIWEIKLSHSTTQQAGT